MTFTRFWSSIMVIGLLSTAAVSAAEVSMELKGGLNLAKWRGGDSTNYDNNVVVNGIPEDKTFKPGLVAGLGLCIAFNDYLALQPELLYSMKGFRRIYEVSEVVNSQLVKKEKVLYLKVNYTELPILLKITIPAGPVTPNFYLGPAIGTRVKIEGYTKIDGEKEEFNKDEKFIYNNNVRIFDLSIAMGGGIDINVGSGSIIFDMRYTMGLRNVWVGSRVNANIPKEKNSTLSFILGYAIHFNK